MQDKKNLKVKAIKEINDTRREYHRTDGELRAIVDEKSYDLYKKLESWIYDQHKHVESCLLCFQPLSSNLKGKTIGADAINSLWKELQNVKNTFDSILESNKKENTDDILDQTYILAFQELVPIAHKIYEIRTILDKTAGSYLFDED